MPTFFTNSGSFNNISTTGSLIVSGTIYFTSLGTNTQPNLVSVDTASGQLHYVATSSINAATASFVTASNVYGPFGSNSIVSSSYASSSTSASYALIAQSVVGGTSTPGTLSQSLGITAFSFNGGADATVAISSSNLVSNKILKWTGDAFTTSSLHDENNLVTGSVSIQLTGPNSRLTGSFTGSLTGSLFGTASWAQSASIAVNAITSSYITGSVFNSTNPALSASFALTSSLTSFAISSSYASSSTSASFAATSSLTAFAVSASYASASTSASFASTSSLTAFAVSASYASSSTSASFASTSSLTTFAVSASYASSSTSASFASTSSLTAFAVSASYASSSTSASFASTSSLTAFAVSASYASSSTSASFASTSSLTAFAISSSYASSSTSASFASTSSLTAFAVSASYASASTSASFASTSSLTAFAISSSYASSSTSASFASTSSLAVFAISASYASSSTSASFASTSSLTAFAISASYASASTSASFASTSSLTRFAVSASYASSSTSASFASTSSLAVFAISASYASSSTSASFASTSSLTAFAISASYASASTSASFASTSSLTAFAVSASYASASTSASFASTSSLTAFAVSASYASSSTSASFASTSSLTAFAVSASYASSSTSASFALTSSLTTFAISASYASASTSASFASTSSLTAFAISASYASASTSASFASTSSLTAFAISASYASASTSASFASTSSLTAFAISASYASSSTSASFAFTASNVEGGRANYMALWDSATKLNSSSLLYQTGSSLVVAMSGITTTELGRALNKGNLVIAASSSGENILRFQRNAGSPYVDNWGKILFSRDSAAGPYASIESSGYGDNDSGGQDQMNLMFMTAFGGSEGRERMRITNRGLVGINRSGSSVDAQLHVSRSSGLSLKVEGSTTITGSTLLSGSLEIDGIANTNQANFLAYNATNGIVTYFSTSSINAATASNVLGGNNNYITKWSGSTQLTSSVVFETGGTVIVGDTTSIISPARLIVSGNIGVRGNHKIRPDATDNSATLEYIGTKISIAGNNQLAVNYSNGNLGGSGLVGIVTGSDNVLLLDAGNTGSISGRVRVSTTTGGHSVLQVIRSGSGGIAFSSNTDGTTDLSGIATITGSLTVVGDDETSSLRVLRNDSNNLYRYLSIGKLTESLGRFIVRNVQSVGGQDILMELTSSNGYAFFARTTGSAGSAGQVAINWPFASAPTVDTHADFTVSGSMAFIGLPRVSAPNILVLSGSGTNVRVGLMATSSFTASQALTASKIEGGTAAFIPIWAGTSGSGASNQLSNSNIFVSASNIGIGITGGNVVTPGYLFTLYRREKIFLGIDGETSTSVGLLLGGYYSTSSVSTATQLPTNGPQSIIGTMYAQSGGDTIEGVLVTNGDMILQPRSNTAGKIIHTYKGKLRQHFEETGVRFSGSFVNTGSTSLSGSLDIDGIASASQADVLVYNRLTGNVTYLSTASISTTLSGGRTNYMAIWSGSTQITSSTTLYETSSRIGIGTINPTSTLFVSGTTNVFTIKGSGSIASGPVMNVSGSQGNLLAVYDSTTGSVFKVADSTNNAYFEVFSDSTTLIGTASAPALHTTINRTITTGITKLYEVPTASYGAYFVDYYAISSSTQYRAGRFTVARFGGSVVTNDTTASTGANFTFGSNVSASQLIVSASVTGNWTVKALIRAI